MGVRVCEGLSVGVKQGRTVRGVRECVRMCGGGLGSGQRHEHGSRIQASIVEHGAGTSGTPVQSCGRAGGIPLERWIGAGVRLESVWLKRRFSG